MESVTMTPTDFAPPKIMAPSDVTSTTPPAAELVAQECLVPLRRYPPPKHIYEGISQISADFERYS